MNSSKARVFGIPNCDSVKKARKWLEENGIEYEFHDYKKSGISLETLEKWSDKHGFEALINKRGTTWRRLDESDKEKLTRKKAIGMMHTNTSLIKRPVVEYGNTRLIGFDEPQYAEVFE